MQATIKNTVRFDGVGLHSGRPVRMVISPASAGYGIWFKRTDIRFGDAMVPARWDAVDRQFVCFECKGRHWNMVTPDFLERHLHRMNLMAKSIVQDAAAETPATSSGT